MQAISLRPAVPADCRPIWEWRNDEDARAASQSTEPIPLDRHERWFDDALGRPTTRIFIIGLEGLDLGYVRFEVEGDDAEISIALAPEARGRGIGVAAISAGTESVLREGLRRVVARVRAGNEASLGAFLRAGFLERGTEDGDGDGERFRILVREP